MYKDSHLIESNFRMTPRKKQLSLFMYIFLYHKLGMILFKYNINKVASVGFPHCCFCLIQFLANFSSTSNFIS